MTNSKLLQTIEKYQKQFETLIDIDHSKSTIKYMDECNTKLNMIGDILTDLTEIKYAS